MSANFYTSQLTLNTDRYISLASQFSQQPLQLPFVKVVSTHCGNTFANAGNISSVTKQAARKIDSLFITFHNHSSAKAVCIQSFIENFKLTVEEAGNNTYPRGDISMNIWNDHVQSQMLLDALNLNKNSLVSLSHEYYRSCFPMSETNSFAAMGGAGGIPTQDHDLYAADPSNFLLGIPFAADSSHMGGLARTSTDINWTTHGNSQATPIPGSVGATSTKEVFAVNCVFYAVFDWNLIMMSSDSPIPYLCYSIQTILNA
jgi:hypothetical protein